MDDDKTMPDDGEETTPANEPMATPEETPAEETPATDTPEEESKEDSGT